VRPVFAGAASDLLRDIFRDLQGVDFADRLSRFCRKKSKKMPGFLRAWLTVVD